MTKKQLRDELEMAQKEIRVLQEEVEQLTRMKTCLTNKLSDSIKKAESLKSDVEYLEKQRTTIPIVNEDPECATINTDVDISGLFLSRVCIGDVADTAIKEIQKRIAKAIMPFVEIKTSYNMQDDIMTVRGTVRIKKPNGGTLADGFLLDNIRRYAGIKPN